MRQQFKGWFMAFHFQFQNTEKTEAKLREMGRSVLPSVLSKALNDTAFVMRKSVQAEMHSVFDKPTDYTIRTVKVHPSTPEKLMATVAPTYPGGKGIDPQLYLKAEVFGGGRKNKRSENMLTRAGVLPAGMQTSLPKDPYPGSHDGKGNFKGAFIRSLLSYLQAFSTPGFTANMSEKRKSKLADVTRYSSIQTKKTYKMIRGVEYFVSHGQLAGGKGVHDAKNRARHLHPGIYARSGTHGVNIRPVVIFTRKGVYLPRLDFDSVAERANVREVFQRKARAAIYRAWEAR
jgi:hypothetical protein